MGDFEWWEQLDSSVADLAESSSESFILSSPDHFFPLTNYDPLFPIIH